MKTLVKPASDVVKCILWGTWKTELSIDEKNEGPVEMVTDPVVLVFPADLGVTSRGNPQPSCGREGCARRGPFRKAGVSISLVKSIPQVPWALAVHLPVATPLWLSDKCPAC